MPNQAFLNAVRAYWAALEQPGEPPELADSRVDAFIDLLHVTSSAPNAFRLLSLQDDPYSGIAVGEGSKPWRLHWAIQICEMEPFTGPGLDGAIMFVDTITDNDGKHRVYTLKDGMRADIEFRDLASALQWMTAHVQLACGKINDAQFEAVQSQTSALLDDEWEHGPWSGFFVLEELMDAPLPEAWDAISRGQWPLVEAPMKDPPLDREEGWQRRLSYWLTLRFLETRRFELPEDIAVADMDAVHRALADHLIDLEQAIHAGDVPRLIVQLAEDAGSPFSGAAREWIARHDGWRTAAATPSASEIPDAHDEPPPFQHTPFTRKLLGALSESLDGFVSRGELELDDTRKDALLIELITAASDARSVKHMLKKLTATLVDSELIEEIYPSDDQIQDRLKQDLGG